MVQEVRPTLSLPSAYAGGDHGPGTPGIWMRCSSALEAYCITSGVRWISSGSYWTFWFRNAEMVRPLNASSGFAEGSAVQARAPRRERQMQRFKSPRQAQDFLSAHACHHLRPLPATASSPQRRPLSACTDDSLAGLATGDMCPAGSMMPAISVHRRHSFCDQLTWQCPWRVWLSPNVSLRPQPIKLTVPIATG
jgi:hypothetical protein